MWQQRTSDLVIRLSEGTSSRCSDVIVSYVYCRIVGVALLIENRGFAETKGLRAFLRWLSRNSRSRST